LQARTLTLIVRSEGVHELCVAAGETDKVPPILRMLALHLNAMASLIRTVLEDLNEIFVAPYVALFPHRRCSRQLMIPFID
jgi:hypothetical protein